MFLVRVLTLFLFCSFSFYASASASASTVLSKEDKLNICKDAYYRGQLVKTKLENTQKETPKKHSIREYEIEDAYIEKAKTTIFWRRVALSTYTLGSYGLLGTLALFASRIPVYVADVWTRWNDPLALALVAQNPPQAGGLVAGLQALYQFAATSYLFSNIFGNDMREGVNWVRNTGIWAMNQPLVWMGLVNPTPEALNPEVEIEAFQLKFDELKSKLPAPHRSKIESILDRLRTTFAHDTKKVQFTDDVVGEKTALTKDLKRIEMIFKLPRELKVIHKKDYQEKLDALLVNYEPELRTKIQELAAGIEASSKVANPYDPFEGTGTPPTRRVIYLLGPPGTGKTYLGENLANALDLPFIQLSAIELKQLSEVQSKRGENKQPLAFTEKIARLPENKRYKNIVVFVDEFDKIMGIGKSSNILSPDAVPTNGELQSFFLEFFDSKKALFNLGNLEINPVNDQDIDYDMSNMIFVLAGNRHLTDSNNAMVKRIRTTEFNPITEDKRLEITCQNFGEHILTLDLDEKQKSHIEGELPKLVDLVAADMDLNLGIKPLIKTVEDFTDHLSMKFQGSKESFDLLKRLEVHSKEVWDPIVAFNQFKRQFEKRKSVLYHRIVTETESRLEVVDKRFNQGLIDTKTMVNLLNNLERTLNLPGPSRNLVEKQVEIEKKLSEFIDGNYPPEMCERLRSVVQRHIEASGDPEVSARNLVYIFGEPGLGKSTVAKQLAESMGLPVIELRLDGALADLIGRPQGNLFPYAYEEAKFEISQLTRQLLSEKGAPQIPSNAVLLINDAANNNPKEAASLRSFLLNDLLEPTRTELKLNDLLLHIDISKFLIIMTANQLLEEETKGSERSAINDRLDLIEFQSLTEKGWHTVANKIFNKQVGALPFNSTLIDEMVDEYSKLGIGSVRPLENTLLLDYANCIKSANRLGKTCEYDYKRRMQLIKKKEETLKKHSPRQ